VKKESNSGLVWSDFFILLDNNLNVLHEVLITLEGRYIQSVPEFGHQVFIHSVHPFIHSINISEP